MCVQRWEEIYRHDGEGKQSSVGSSASCLIKATATTLLNGVKID
jgi:hypothetical protein